MTNESTDRAKQIIVITGASTGIGRACALHLDGLGFAVYAGVRRDADGDALRAAASPRLTPIRIDVTDAESIALARKQVDAACGGHGVRGLVNNAGVGVGGPIEYVPLDDLRRQLEVNVIGQVAVTQAFLPLLRQAKGRIVNIGSIAGRFATPFLGPYSASKFALEAITDALRVELRPWGINVAIVEPGSIATPIWEKAKTTTEQVRDGLPPEGRELYGGVVDSLGATMAEFEKRAIPAERVAKAVTHALLSKRPKTRYLVGNDARLQAALATVVPDRITDRLVARQLKLPRG
jgi:NAD(P)-dependent dehydrogenase (short-subunit alcohol dehydrogenase family)